MRNIVFRIESGADVTIPAADGDNLLALARLAEVTVDAPCSGNGSCGKCRMKLIDGSVGGAQSRHISDSDAAGGWRLACAATIVDDAVLLVPDIAQVYNSRIEVADLSLPEETAVIESFYKCFDSSVFSRGCGIRTVVLHIAPPSLDDAMPDNERICRAAAAVLGISDITLPYPVLKTVPELLRDNAFNVRCVTDVSGDRAEILDLLPGVDNTPACGVAIDIGTTTVSALLADLETGEILAKVGVGNSQIRYGADVINRIIEQTKPGGVEKMRQAIVDGTLLPLIDCMCADAGISRNRIYRVSIASNTTMNHLLLGINANFLRMEPYIPAFFNLPRLDPSNAGIPLAPTATMSVAPNIGSYVGGDITAGTLISMMWNDPGLSVLIDLGTNGEIVFGNNDFLLACACSAGPAFEGGDISNGMRAVDGAIETCLIDPGTMAPEYTVIGGNKPVGLCGSGLIDTVAELFRTGIINSRGRFIRKGVRVRHDEYGTGSYILVFARDTATGRDITVNEVDIDNFIRAKGAIFSAVMSLITPAGFALEDIGRIMVAGGIGSGINIGNAIRIGMLPDLPEEKYRYIGNSALCGAYATLVSSHAQQRLHEVAGNMTYIELSAQQGYMDEFIAACFLPHTNQALFPSAAL